MHPNLRTTVSGPVVAFSQFLKTTEDLFYSLVPTLPEHRSALKESSLLIPQFFFFDLRIDGENYFQLKRIRGCFVKEMAVKLVIFG